MSDPVDGVELTETGSTRRQKTIEAAMAAMAEADDDTLTPAEKAKARATTLPPTATVSSTVQGTSTATFLSQPPVIPPPTSMTPTQIAATMPVFDKSGNVKQTENPFAAALGAFSVGEISMAELIGFVDKDSHLSMEAGKRAIKNSQNTMDFNNAEIDKNQAAEREAREKQAACKKIEQIFAVIGAALSWVVALALMATGVGAVAGACLIAGATVATAYAIGSVTGLNDKIVEAIAKSLESNGMSKEQAAKTAAMIFGFAVIAIELALAIPTMGGSLINAAKTIGTGIANAATKAATAIASAATKIASEVARVGVGAAVRGALQAAARAAITAATTAARTVGGMSARVVAQSVSRAVANALAKIGQAAGRASQQVVEGMATKSQMVAKMAGAAQATTTIAGGVSQIVGAVHGRDAEYAAADAKILLATIIRSQAIITEAIEMIKSAADREKQQREIIIGDIQKTADLASTLVAGSSAGSAA